MTEALTLTHHELYGSLFDDDDFESSASYYVYAKRGNGPERAYSLTVMSEEAYEKWFFELTYNDDPEIKDHPVTFPLIVPMSIAAEGLRRFVEDRYLNSDNPSDINQIRPFLDGPLDTIE